MLPQRAGARGSVADMAAARYREWIKIGGIVTVPSYPAPAPRSRPTIVTVATYLLYFVAAVQLINAIIAFALAGRVSDAVRGAYTGTEAEGTEAVFAVAFVIGGVINLLLGLGFGALAFLDGRGKNPARIVTWVIGGISLCCLGVNLSGTALVGALDDGSTTGGVSQDELQQRIDSALPSWYGGVTTTLAVLALLAILATVILLALPAANEFFRKRPATAWDPAMPFPPYSGQPGYGQPPYPGQPYPGQPGYGPSYPGQPGYGPSYPGQQGQPGQPAPGLPPYPGQTGEPAPGHSPYPGQQPPPAADPYGPTGDQPPSSGGQSPTGGDQPPRPPADPA